MSVGARRLFRSRKSTSSAAVILKAPFARGQRWTASTRDNHVGTSSLPTDFNHWPENSDYGQPVLAPADGTVTNISVGAEAGNILSLDHGQGIITRYGHLKDIVVSVGDTVSVGQIIAHVGNTGSPGTRAHLHMAVLRYGNFIPIAFDGVEIAQGRGYNSSDPAIISTNAVVPGATVP